MMIIIMVSLSIIKLYLQHVSNCGNFNLICYISYISQNKTLTNWNVTKKHPNRNHGWSTNPPNVPPPRNKGLTRPQKNPPKQKTKHLWNQHPQTPSTSENGPRAILISDFSFGAPCTQNGRCLLGLNRTREQGTRCWLKKATKFPFIYQQKKSLDLLNKMLGKSKKHPKWWWFNGDLAW